MNIPFVLDHNSSLRSLRTHGKKPREKSINITVVARITAKDDAVEAVKSELLKMVAPARREEGCMEYRLHQDNGDPAVFVCFMGTGRILPVWNSM